MTNVTYHFEVPTKADVTLWDDVADGGKKTFVLSKGEYEIKTLEKLG